MNDHASELLNDKQVAAYLGITTRTLRLWRRRGLPHLKLTGRVIRYRQSDLDTWINRSRKSITK